MLRSVLWLLCFVLIQGQAWASSEVSLSGRWFYIHDSGLDIKQVKESNLEWKKSKWSSPNLGFEDKPYWFRLQFKAGEINDGKWIFWIQNGLLSDIQFYQFENNILKTKQINGNKILFESRSLPYRFPAFGFSEDSTSDTEIYLRVVSDTALQLPAILLTEKEFTQRKEQQDSLFGLFLGILIAMMLYNLVLYFSIKEKTYLLYVGHAVGLLFFVISWQGIGPTYIWPNVIWLQNGSIGLATFAVIGFSTWFCGEFLNLTPSNFSLYRFFWMVRNLGFIGCLVTFLIPHQWSIYLSSIFSFVAILMVVKAMQERANMHYRPARLFVFGWTFYVLGALVMGLNKFGFIEVTPASENLLLWGSVLDMVLLCIALGDKFHEERNVKIRAQEMAIKAVDREKKEKEKALEQERLAREALEESAKAQENYSRLLEKKVLERTKELQGTLRELEQISERDALTGLKNRRYFLDRLYEEMKRSRHLAIPFSILMVDIDHFKMINDTYGHLAGDECIRRVGDLLKQQLKRPGDVVCRYGGEEFVVILANTEQDGALAMAESMRTKIAACPMQCGENRIMLTISVGLMNVCSDKLPEQAEGIINEADKALYEAKTLGRNCVCVA